MILLPAFSSLSLQEITYCTFHFNYFTDQLLDLSSLTSGQLFMTPCLCTRDNTEKESDFYSVGITEIGLVIIGWDFSHSTKIPPHPQRQMECVSYG